MSSFGYLSCKGKHDPNVLPDFLSGPDSWLSKEKSSHLWSAVRVSPLESKSSHEDLGHRASLDSGERDHQQDNLMFWYGSKKLGYIFWWCKLGRRASN